MTNKRFESSRRNFLSLGAASMAVLALSSQDEQNRRRRIGSDRHRPQYHIVAPAHFLNDPNGPFYWRGIPTLVYTGAFFEGRPSVRIAPKA